MIIGIGCRYLSHATRPLKSSTAQPTLRIGKIRLWLNRIKRGKFTFGNSKSERVEGSSRVAPAPLLCTCLLSLPPLLLLYSILSPRFRETDASSLFRLVLHGIVPLERCTMRTPQSSRLFTHRRKSIPCIAFCFQTRAPTLERGGGSSWHGYRRGGKKGEEEAQVHFTRPWLVFVTFVTRRLVRKAGSILGKREEVVRSLFERLIILEFFLN